MTMYLIEKRGLYYRPKAAGYTGMKKNAGRYSLDEVAEHFPNKESPNQDGMTYVSEDDAPEFSTRCPWDMKLVELTRLKARNDAMREVADKMYQRFYPKNEESDWTEFAKVHAAVAIEARSTILALVEGEVS